MSAQDVPERWPSRWTSEIPDARTNVSDIIAKEIEIEGQRYLCQKKLSDKGDPLFSMDGVTWWPSIINAFGAAKESGKLLTRHESPDTPSDEFEAWILVLYTELMGLKNGEKLTLQRLGDEILMAKEQVLVTLRGSALDAMREGEDGPR